MNSSQTKAPPRRGPRLYRGVGEALPPSGLHGFIREDRRPRSTGNAPVFNICFNLMIERRFGVPLVRRRALFVSGNIRQAARYAGELDAAHIGVVTPVGPFRFVYHPAVSDSMSLVRRLTTAYLSCFRKWQLERCKPLLEDTGLTVASAQAFFDANPQIDAGGFSWGDTTLRSRYFAMLDRLTDPASPSSLTYRDDDLTAAAASGAEVLIFDCPKGYKIVPANPDEIPAEPEPDPWMARLKAIFGLESKSVGSSSGTSK